MPESSNTPAAEGGEWAKFDLRNFVVQTIRSIEFGDMLASGAEGRVARIEECIAAPWYRRWLLWRRLRREIRASVATWDPEYIPKGDFLGRRAEWAMEAASRRYDRGAWKPRFDGADQPTAEGAQDAPEQPGEDGSDPGAGFLP